MPIATAPKMTSRKPSTSASRVRARATLRAVGTVRFAAPTSAQPRRAAAKSTPAGKPTTSPMSTPPTVELTMKPFCRSVPITVPSIRTNQVDTVVSSPGVALVHIRALPPGKFAHDDVVRAVDRLEHFVVGDSPVEGERVPTRPSNVGHDGGVGRVPGEPLIGYLPIGSAFEPDRFAVQ